MTVAPYVRTFTGVDSRDWCDTIGYFHAFERVNQGPFKHAWRCVFCGQLMVGRMPVSMRFYVVTEEP